MHTKGVHINFQILNVSFRFTFYHVWPLIATSVQKLLTLSLKLLDFVCFCMLHCYCQEFTQDIALPNKLKQQSIKRKMNCALTLGSRKYNNLW
jgi:hypothetical protein